MTVTTASGQTTGLEIAVIGMAGRFPGARNVEQFWENLKNGVESVRVFSDDELIANGLDPALLSNPNYVKAGGVVEDADLFDAKFFDYTRREAELIDPQQRIFLECAWEALENAGYETASSGNRIGVYAGLSMNTYFLNLISDRSLIDSLGPIQLLIGSDKDHLATRVSYKLNLEGPSVVVQAGCSTSLVAVHLACRSLLSGDCDMALAGGVSVNNYLKSGYLYQEGGILSPDGHCRAFDAKAQGTVFGSGVGVVVLKRLEDALADGDTLHAIIKSSHINNDGEMKVGYTAPRVEGQAKAIRAAQYLAEVEPETITYIEAHGTGTALGDPMEVEALTEVFRERTTKKNFCAIGSVKTNIGHLDAASGVAGLIKIILALKHRMLPPSLHFETPNPKINFPDSPFYVNNKLRQWRKGETSRRAAANSFGIGGTNAHVILEEAPAVDSANDGRSIQLLIISAKTSPALEAATQNLAQYLKQTPDASLADVAYTLQVGRRPFQHRRMLICSQSDEAARNLEIKGSRRVFTGAKVSRELPALFMFSGQGTQYVQMGRRLYETEPTFRQQVDRCCELLEPHLGFDLRQLLYPSASDAETSAQQLRQTAIAEPAIFVTEYALAHLLIEWGIRPAAMIGHSSGEYVAACVAGVFSLEDALRLTAVRGRLAFHSQLMDPILNVFASEVAKVDLHSPTIPYVSNVTGDWITTHEATDPRYWARHLRHTVRFADGIKTLTKDADWIALEVGPGRTLCTMAKQQLAKQTGTVLLPTLPPPHDPIDSVEFLMRSVGGFWLAGGRVDWHGFHAHERRRRIPLPTYPFERQRYWIEPRKNGSKAIVESAQTTGDSVDSQLCLPNNSNGRPKEIDKRVAALFEELLGEEVNVNANFFELGVHSLLATQVASRLREEFSVKLSLQELFEASTVASLASVIAQRQEKSTEDSAVIPRRHHPDHAVLSFAQQRLWFFDQLIPGDPLQTMPVSMRLRGNLDVQVLERSLNEILRRHESLRTTFSTVDDEPVQLIAPSATISIPVIDLRSFTEAERTRKAQALAKEERLKPFDLTRGPLIRVTLLHLNTDDYMLLLTIHHIVSDAWSFAVLTRELTALYQAFAAEKPSPLPELLMQYADFAEWQHQHMVSNEMNRQLDYWKQQLEGAPPLLELPADHPRPAVQSHRGAVLSFQLPQDLTESLKTLGQREGATLSMVLLAAFQTLLYRLSGTSDLIVGIDVANRNRRELEGLVGFFVNMLVLRMDLSGNPSFTKLLKRVREITLAAYEHQDVPFDKLVEELQPARSQAYSPLFQVVFNFYQDPAEGLDLPGVTIDQLDSYQDVSKFDLSLFVSEGKNGVGGFWSYSTDLFEPDRIKRSHELLVNFLQTVATTPEVRLDALEMVTEAEKQQLQTRKKELKASSFKKFKSVRATAIGAQPQKLVEMTHFRAEENLPLIIEPAVEGLNLAHWLRNSAEFLEEQLVKCGGILFRGFQIDSLTEFDATVRAVSPELLDYREPSSPRSALGGNIYTSTEYPASQWIQLHNEMSYSSRWPGKIFFCCVTPPESGGETPIASSRRVFDLLDPKIREAFMNRKVMYVRNFSPQLDLSWQNVFQTTSRSEVEAYCRSTGISFSWREGDRLSTSQVRQAVLVHPRTGDMVWFNQVHAFHSATLEPAVRQALEAEMPIEEFPRQALYGDGSPIEDSVIAEICEAYRQAAVTFTWRQGDLLLLENMLVAHGRAPFCGPRKILVAMSELINGKDIDPSNCPSN